jgi:pimeloyl-ACP methyl ester carboxylesterase
MQRRHFIYSAASAAAFAAACGRISMRSAGASEIDVSTFHRMRRFAPTASGRIAYVERGAGPAALFIHGLPLNGYQWRGALERLGARRRCIAPDLMGLGYSEISATQDLSPEAQTEMLLQLLDALQIATVDLVASDSGDAVAQLLVARAPMRVRTMLLTNGDVHTDSPPPLLKPVIEASRAGTFVDEVLVPQLRDPSASLLPNGLAGCCYTRPMELSPEAIECYLAPLAASRKRKDQLHGYCVALDRNPLVALEAVFGRSDVPVRVVWGTGDVIFSRESPHWLDRTFPRSRGVRIVEGANLFFPEEMPDLIAEEALRLWGDEGNTGLT